MRPTDLEGIAAEPSRFYVSELEMPQDETDFAADVDFDGRRENRMAYVLAQIRELLATELRSKFTMPLEVGRNVILLSSWPGDGVASGAELPERVVLQQGEPNPWNALPFTEAEGSTPVSLSEVVEGAELGATVAALRRPTPVAELGEVSLAAALRWPGDDLVELPFVPQRVELVIGADGTLSGRMSGHVRDADLRWRFMASLLRAMLTSFPHIVDTFALLLDRGDHSGPDGRCINEHDGTEGVAGDGVVSPCELMAQPEIAELLQPDVRIYRDGPPPTYDPQTPEERKRTGAAPDAYSFGFGFTARPIPVDAP